jgi:hypothetical protein
VAARTGQALAGYGRPFFGRYVVSNDAHLVFIYHRIAGTRYTHMQLAAKFVRSWVLEAFQSRNSYCDEAAVAEGSSYWSYCSVVFTPPDHRGKKLIVAINEGTLCLFTMVHSYLSRPETFEMRTTNNEKN